jgi:inhibitor of KinA sporulation pathway (predicted exonuclease)
MMQISNAYYLIIDVEATCADDGSVPRDEMEIIEIGAVLQDARTFDVVSEFQTFVRPVRNPLLTEFCTGLTSIRQADVEAAPLFPEALAALQQWLAGYDDALFCSWGNYDKTQFERDCAFHNLDYPFGPDHMNLKAEFARATGQRRQRGLSAALRHLGLTFDGTPHRGIDDARNMARIVQHVLAGG